MDLKSLIRTIPDCPHEGILFRDITTLFADARGFRRVVDELVQPYAGQKIDAVARIEARGFILGGVVAHQLAVGFIPVRKKGRLPWETIGADHALEYGTDRVENPSPCHRTRRARPAGRRPDRHGRHHACRHQAAARGRRGVVRCSFVELGGSAKLSDLGTPFHALMQFEGA